MPITARWRSYLAKRPMLAVPAKPHSRSRRAVWGLCLLLTAGALHADPRIDYLLHCGGCHLADGAGDPPLVPDLRAELDFFASHDAGRAYLAQVPGTVQAPLSDEQLAEVMNWMLASFFPGKTFEAFSGTEIGRYRSTPLLDPLQRRAELLARP